MPLLIWGAATALALLLNPRGLEVIGYVRNLLGTSAVTSLVTEWAPPTIRDLGGMIFFLFLLLCIIVLAYARRMGNASLERMGNFNAAYYLYWRGDLDPALPFVRRAIEIDEHYFRQGGFRPDGAVLLARILWASGDEAYHRHEGLFMRLDAGGGFLKAATTINGSSGALSSPG